MAWTKTVNNSKVVMAHSYSHGNKCGPMALLGICRILDISVGLEKVVALSNLNDFGTSMYGLSQAAKSLGLNAVGIEADLDTLTQLQKPSIIFVNNNHYIAIVGYGNNCFQVVDSGRLYTIQKAKLEKKYSGKALVISKKGDPALLAKIYKISE